MKSNNQLPPDRFNDLATPALGPRLERLADVRRAVVARGRALIANPHYPDQNILRAISRLLAFKLRP